MVEWSLRPVAAPRVTPTSMTWAGSAVGRLVPVALGIRRHADHVGNVSDAVVARVIARLGARPIPDRQLIAHLGDVGGGVQVWSFRLIIILRGAGGGGALDAVKASGPLIPGDLAGALAAGVIAGRARGIL